MRDGTVLRPRAKPTGGVPISYSMVALHLLHVVDSWQLGATLYICIMPSVQTCRKDGVSGSFSCLEP